MLKALKGLRRCISGGRLEIDNNPVKRCIRGIALTKKDSSPPAMERAGRFGQFTTPLLRAPGLLSPVDTDARREDTGLVHLLEDDFADFLSLPW